ncbi:MAG: 50S ribosomal protein L29 [Spirochaetes bacterium]|nr:50S ribosomal protein L29 [Spirochaetota bacterium]
MKAKEIRNMKNEELLNLLNDLVNKKREIRFNLQVGQVEDISSLTKTKRDIARIKTILRERNVIV